MRTIVHRLEYQDNLKTKRFEFMAPYFAEHKHIFVNLTEYSFPFEKFMALFKFLPKHIDAVLIVLPQLLTDDQHAQLNQLIPTYRVDTLMHESYQLTPEHTAWDRQADKFVCLTGGPQKYNRYRLIVELHKADLLKHSVYSLQVNPTLYDTCLDLLEHDDKAYYSDKFEMLNSNPDNSTWHVVNKNWVHMCFDDNSILNNKLFRVVSETVFVSHDNMQHGDTMCISEKTWLTIGYKLPFIMAGQPGTLAYLKQMGFNTFDEWLIEPYDLIEDPKERMNSIIRNTEHWVNTLKDAQGVDEAVQHNYNRFIELSKMHEITFKDAYNKLDIPYDPDIVSMRGYQQGMVDTDGKYLTG